MNHDTLLVTAGRVAAGVWRPPGSKSVANRYLPLAAMAAGTSRIAGLPDGDDVAVMIRALGRLGVDVRLAGGLATVVGSGNGPIGNADVDVSASGTTMRFLTGLAATGSGTVTLDGTPRMRERPIGPLVTALRALGAVVDELGEPGHPPLRVRGPLRGGRVRIDASVSSQFISAVMLAAPLCAEGVEIELTGEVVSRPYLDATVEAMAAFGAEAAWTAPDVLSVAAGGYTAADVTVPPDASGAVYGWVAAAITGGDVLVPGLRRHTTQADVRVLDALAAMGAEVVEEADGIRVRGRGLTGVHRDLSDAPDGALGLAAAAALADGASRFEGLGTLRVKETDRLHALETELRKLGVDATAGPDALEVAGQPRAGAVIETYDDHRMAMSFALIGLRHAGVVIADPGTVSKTWPDYFAALADLALHREVVTAVAIDGPAGVGKSTISERIAERLGGVRLDTGAFYRTATVLAQRLGLTPGPDLAAALADHEISYADGRIRLDGADVSDLIRTPGVNAGVSAVAADPDVRRALVVAQQRWVATAWVPVVAEGRDIGTVVLPNALTKIFLTARPEVRARRRAAEVGSDPVDELRRLTERDRIDSERATDPLRSADDAHTVDTSDLDIPGVVDAIWRQHEHRLRVRERWQRALVGCQTPDTTTRRRTPDARR